MNALFQMSLMDAANKIVIGGNLNRHLANDSQTLDSKTMILCESINY